MRVCNARLRAVEPTCASDRDSEGEIDRTTKRRRKNYRVNPGEDTAFCERSVGYSGDTRDLTEGKSKQNVADSVTLRL